MNLAAENTTTRFGLRWGAVVGALAGLFVGVGVTALHSARSASAPSASVATAQPSGATESMSLSEQVARHERLHQEAIERHDREARDPAWSVRTEKIIADVLAALSPAGKFQVKALDCRTSSCVAVLRVANYRDAQNAWPDIVRAHNDAGCGTEITLLQAKVDAMPYDFSAVYDCSHDSHAP